VPWQKGRPTVDVGSLMDLVHLEPLGNSTSRKVGSAAWIATVVEFDYSVNKSLLFYCTDREDISSDSIS
jgi:hypothetical protein